MYTDRSHTTIDIPGFFTNKGQKRLIFKPEGLAIEKIAGIGSQPFLAYDDIAAFRYDVKFLRGSRFTVGRQYRIEIQDLSGKVTNLKLTSVYGIRKDTYNKIWGDILHQLWHYYFINILNYYRELKNIGQVFELAGVKFQKFGISWDDGINMAWNEIAMTNYTTYFMIYRADYHRHRKSCSFATDWNAVILQALLKEIIEEEKALKSL